MRREEHGDRSVERLGRTNNRSRKVKHEGIKPPQHNIGVVQRYQEQKASQRTSRATSSEATAI